MSIERVIDEASVVHEDNLVSIVSVEREQVLKHSEKSQFGDLGIELLANLSDDSSVARLAELDPASNWDPEPLLFRRIESIYGEDTAIVPKHADRLYTHIASQRIVHPPTVARLTT